MTFFALLYVAAGGAVGSMARYALMMLITRLHGTEFPFGTLAVNILGGFLMGAWISAMATMLPVRAKDLHLLFAVGVLGGFTTFSTFSLDIVLLIDRGLMGQAALYVLSSVVISVLALMAGMWCFRMFA